MGMDEISMDKAMTIAQEKQLRPAKVKGTDIIQFTKSERDTPRFELIPWENFEDVLSSRGLKVFESGGWMKIMKK